MFGLTNLSLLRNPFAWVHAVVIFNPCLPQCIWDFLDPLNLKLQGSTGFAGFLGFLWAEALRFDRMILS